MYSDIFTRKVVLLYLFTSKMSVKKINVELKKIYLHLPQTYLIVHAYFSISIEFETYSILVRGGQGGGGRLLLFQNLLNRNSRFGNSQKILLVVARLVSKF